MAIDAAIGIERDRCFKIAMRAANKAMREPWPDGERLAMSIAKEIIGEDVFVNPRDMEHG